METHNDEYVEGAAFVAAVADCVTAIERLSSAALALPEAHGYLPVADSRAMAELAAESRLAHWGWAEPVHEAHTLMGLLSFAGIDHLRSYGHLFTSDPIPVYSHLATARAALEAFGWTQWIADPAVDVDTRVKRERAYQLDDVLQRKRLGLDESKASAKEILQRIRTSAPPDWQVICNDRQIVVGGESLPSTAKVIESALGAVAPTRDTLGRTLWSMLSGATHSTRYALTMGLGPPTDLGEVGPVIAPLSTSSRTVHLIGVVCLRAAINACDARFSLLGWNQDKDWQDSVNATDAYIRQVMRTAL